MGLMALVAAMSLHAKTAVSAPLAFQTALAVDLQPLRGVTDRPEWFAAELKPIVQAYQRKQWAKACTLSDAKYKRLMQTAARLFFGPERKKAQTEAIEQFLDSKVRGTPPVLEVAAEGFVPAAPWRSITVDACVRADLPAIAVAQIGLIASVTGDGAAVVALAVARGQADRSWASAAAIVAKSKDGLRVVLLRALAEPPTARHWLAAAEQHLQTGDDRALLSAVRRACGEP